MVLLTAYGCGPYGAKYENHQNLYQRPTYKGLQGIQGSPRPTAEPSIINKNTFQGRWLSRFPEGRLSEGSAEHGLIYSTQRPHRSRHLGLFPNAKQLTTFAALSCCDGSRSFLFSGCDNTAAKLLKWWVYHVASPVGLVRASQPSRLRIPHSSCVKVGGSSEKWEPYDAKVSRTVLREGLE